MAFHSVGNKVAKLTNSYFSEGLKPPTRVRHVVQVGEKSGFGEVESAKSWIPLVN